MLLGNPFIRCSLKKMSMYHKDCQTTLSSNRRTHTGWILFYQRDGNARRYWADAISSQHASHRTSSWSGRCWSTTDISLMPHVAHTTSGKWCGGYPHAATTRTFPSLVHLSILTKWIHGGQETFTGGTLLLSPSTLQLLSADQCVATQLKST